MNSYLDASALLPTLIDEPTTAAVEDYLASHRDRLISDFAAAEVASAFSRLVRTRRLDSADASARLTEFEGWRTMTAERAEINAADARLAYAYVRRFDLMLRAPDALHIAMAQRLGATLVTLDRRMAGAAATLGIAVEIPGTLGGPR